MDAVRTVYSRACKIHLPKKPYIHMAWASFEERQGLLIFILPLISNLEQLKRIRCFIPGFVNK